MVVALQAAAYRGVEVSVMIPTLTNQRVVLWAGRSFYESLCRAGVEIYEHDETMLHSLQDRGLVESDGAIWRVTQTGQKRLNDRD